MLVGSLPLERASPICGRACLGPQHDVLTGGARTRASSSIVNAGTIPDRGLYGVYLGAGGPRVGELDEEMVHESRVGQTFLLGASSWRILEITRDRVIVQPAPGEPGRMPFWRGEGPGRPIELGRALGAFVRDARAPCSRRPALVREHLREAYRPRRARRGQSLRATSTSSARRPASCPPIARSRRALPRRARRLAGVSPVAVRRARARPPRPRHRGAARGAHRRDGAGALLRRRDRPAPGGHRNATSLRRALARPRGATRAGPRAAPSSRRCSRRTSARMRRVRCSCRGGGRARAPRCGRSASGRRPSSPSRVNTRASPSCSRPSASA